MAFPQTVAPTTSAFDTDATAHLVTMPATIDAGDLLLVGFVNDGGATVTTPANWNLLASDQDASAQVRLSLYYKIAVGDEDGTTVDFVTSAIERAAAEVYRVTAWHGTTPPEISAAASLGNPGSTAPDPNSLNPTGWDVEDTLWFAFGGADARGNTFTGFPTSYTNGTSTTSGVGAGGVTMGSARRELAAASDDPSAFTITIAEQWVAYTVAVRPAAASAVTVGSRMALMGVGT